jgi:AmmeMemoRadiSam system protein A
MTEEERHSFLELARKSVSAASQGFPLPSIPDGEAFRGKGGVFVTLKKNKTLRGCIGHFSGYSSLGETIVKMASAAAVDDPRFIPVSPDELPELTISISLLSPMTRTDAEDIETGNHGVYIRSGPHSGTLLPQVAKEEGWDREALLSHTCMKAGLHPDAWRSSGDIEIFTYTAEVFSETKNDERSQQT